MSKLTFILLLVPLWIGVAEDKDPGGPPRPNLWLSFPATNDGTHVLRQFSLLQSNTNKTSEPRTGFRLPSKLRSSPAPGVINTNATPLPPGVYRTEPYASIQIVPGATSDDKMVQAPPSTPHMLTSTPELRFIPLGSTSTEPATNSVADAQHP